MVAARRHLPGLSALVPRHRRGRHRGSPRHHWRAGLPAVARRGRDLDLAHLPIADGRFRIRRHGLHGDRPTFGTLADLDRLLVEAHRRGIEGHPGLSSRTTPRTAPWFTESRSSRDNPKRDWYIWRDPDRTAARPTTGCSVFGGSAWDVGPARSSTTTTHISRSSPTSTGATPRSGTQCATCCASGWSAAWTASAWTCSGSLIKDDAVPRQPGQPWRTRRALALRRALPVYTTDRPEVHEVVARDARALLDELPATGC